MDATKIKKGGYKDKIKQALMTQKKLSELTGIHPVRMSTVLNSSSQHFTDDELTKISLVLKIQL